MTWPPPQYHPMTLARQEHLAAIVTLAAAEKRARRFCPAGHEYTGSNLYIRPDGRRMCRRCRRNQAARFRLQKRLAGY